MIHKTQNNKYLNKKEKQLIKRKINKQKTIKQ